MPKYGDAAWRAKALKRKVVRDRERERFKNETGLKPVHAMDDIALAPEQQLRKMVSLIKLTRKGDLDGVHKEALVLMAKELAGVRLGRGLMGHVAQALTSPHETHSKNLLDFFILDYDHRSRE